MLDFTVSIMRAGNGPGMVEPVEAMVEPFELMPDNTAILEAIGGRTKLIHVIGTQTRRIELDIRGLMRDDGGSKTDVGGLNASVVRIETKLDRYETRIEERVMVLGARPQLRLSRFCLPIRSGALVDKRASIPFNAVRAAQAGAHANCRTGLIA
jgi:hypothetical protein